jgi:hypothetical protein
MEAEIGVEKGCPNWVRNEIGLKKDSTYSE